MTNPNHRQRSLGNSLLILTLIEVTIEYTNVRMFVDRKLYCYLLLITYIYIRLSTGPQPRFVSGRQKHIQHTDYGIHTAIPASS